MRLGSMRGVFKRDTPEDVEVLDAMHAAYWLAGEAAVWPMVVQLFDQGASAGRIVHAFEVAMRITREAA